MTKLDEILTEWKSDSEMDETEAGRELLKIPKLHAKYHGYLSMYTLLKVKTEGDIGVRRKFLFDYYLGKLTQAQLKEAGVEPWQHTTVRQDLQWYIDADATLNTLIQKKALYEAIITLATNILKELNQRTWQLKSFVDYEKFLSGS